ncbi:MAG: hypothetical protein IT285_13990 [Bdellovibrionales bacterium]|nr:hypothetical protein [Bdellovibrionales bacterium]
MRFRGAFLLQAFLLVPPGAGAAPLGESAFPAHEAPFFCAELSQCLVDLRALLAPAAGAADALRRARLADLEGRASRLSDARALERGLGPLVAAADSCADFRDELQCRVPSAQVDRILAKVRFEEGPSDPGALRFEWTASQKDFARRRLRQAVCEGGTPVEAWLAVDRIDLFNSSCFEAPAGEVRILYFIRIPRVERYCQNATYSGGENRIRISGSFLHNSSLLRPDGISAEFFPRLLDHELAHARFHLDPAFQLRAAEFLSLRFFSAGLEALTEAREAVGRVTAAPAYLRALPAERDRLIDAALRPILARHRIPVRTDAGGGGAALRLSDGEAFQGLDVHALEGAGGEYLAYAVELALHDPEEAARVFNEAELDWLERNAGSPPLP